MTFTLPPSDGAFGTLPFGDPLVLPIMSIFASIGAIVVYPFTYFSLRDRPLPKSLAILVVCVLLEIVVVTPISPQLGFIGSLVAYGVGLVVACALTDDANVVSGSNKVQFSLRTLLMVVSTVAILLAICFVLRPNRNSQLLIGAAYRRDLKSVKDLIAKGARIDVRDGWSGTPLMYANGRLDIVKALVEAGANVNERSRMGRTPLMWAANGGHIDVVRYLLTKGANPALLDDNGESATDLAGKNGFNAIAAELRSFNALPTTQKRP